MLPTRDWHCLWVLGESPEFALSKVHLSDAALNIQQPFVVRRLSVARLPLAARLNLGRRFRRLDHLAQSSHSENHSAIFGLSL